MPIDYSILSQFKSVGDYDAERQDRELKNQLLTAKLADVGSAGNLPAPLQLANEYQKRMVAGDLEGANLIREFAKTQDRGIVAGADGTFQPLPGYAPAVGTIEAAKGGMKRQAESNVDLVMKPQIGRSTAFQEALGKGEAEVQTGLGKKGQQAENMFQLADEAEALLPQASGGRIGAGYAAGKGLFNVSDESTQANARLKIIAAGLTAAVPRMEGPQSDADRIMYQQAAGDVGNIAVPTGDRLAALKTIRDLQQKYIRTPESLDDVLSNYQGNQPTPNKPSTPTMKPADIQASIFNARKAIKKNPANREAIIQRLEQAGIPTGGL